MIDLKQFVGSRNLDPDNTFFTSDTHFNHAKIIELADRPFKDVEEMNEALIENWNNVVNEDSVVFHLGDVAFGGVMVIKGILTRLKGRKRLIIGNHDHRQNFKHWDAYFEAIQSQASIRIADTELVLNHYPFLCYGGSYRNVINLFGHVHSVPGVGSGLDIPRLSMLFPTQYDVGVDNNNFTPISFRKVMEIINNKLN